MRDEEFTQLALLTFTLLIGAIIVESLRHPTRKARIVVRGTKVEVEPVAAAGAG
jgi:hypothetical protein